MTASDNDRCISLRGHGWLPKFLQQRLGMPVYAPQPLTLQPIFRITQHSLFRFHCDGNNPFDVFSATSAAVLPLQSISIPKSCCFMVDIRYTTAAAAGSQLLSCSVVSRAALAMRPQTGESLCS